MEELAPCGSKFFPFRFGHCRIVHQTGSHKKVMGGKSTKCIHNKLYITFKVCLLINFLGTENILSIYKINPTVVKCPYTGNDQSK